MHGVEHVEDGEKTFTVPLAFYGSLCKVEKCTHDVLNNIDKALIPLRVKLVEHLITCFLFPEIRKCLGQSATFTSAQSGKAF